MAEKWVGGCKTSLARFPFVYRPYGGWLRAGFAEALENTICVLHEPIQDIDYPQKKENPEILASWSMFQKPKLPKIKLNFFSEIFIISSLMSIFFTWKDWRDWKAAAMLTDHRLVQCPHRTVTMSYKLLHGTLTCPQKLRRSF